MFWRFGIDCFSWVINFLNSGLKPQYSVNFCAKNAFLFFWGWHSNVKFRIAKSFWEFSWFGYFSFFSVSLSKVVESFCSSKISFAKTIIFSDSPIFLLLLGAKLIVSSFYEISVFSLKPFIISTESLKTSLFDS